MSWDGSALMAMSSKVGVVGVTWLFGGGGGESGAPMDWSLAVDRLIPLETLVGDRTFTVSPSTNSISGETYPDEYLLPAQSPLAKLADASKSVSFKVLITLRMFKAGKKTLNDVTDIKYRINTYA